MTLLDLRKRTFSTMLALCLSGAVISDPDRDEPTDSGFYLGGIQVHEEDHQRWADTLRDVGMNTVAVTVYAKQGNWDTDHLWFEDDEPAVLDEIRTARAEGLSVVLILRVAIDHAYPRNKFVWHGMIMPASPEAIRGWFERYGAFVSKWAAIGEAEGVELLGIGSELNTMTATLPVSRVGNIKNYQGTRFYEKFYRKRARAFSHEIEQKHLWVRGFENHETLEGYLDDRYETKKRWARQAYLRAGGHTLRRINERRALIDGLWVDLIGQVRKIYSGKLTYAANFDAYDEVGFWDHLDVIGINAYFQLKPTIDETQDDADLRSVFTRRWEKIGNRITQFKHKQGIDDMPVVFTELGYTFRRHSTVEPWAHDGFSVVGWRGHERRLVVWKEQPIDYSERSLALETLLDVRNQGGFDLNGILYWKLSTDASHEAIEPFVLHIGADSQDPLQQVLVDFTRP